MKFVYLALLNVFFLAMGMGFYFNVLPSDTILFSILFLLYFNVIFVKQHIAKEGRKFILPTILLSIVFFIVATIVLGFFGIVFYFMVSF